MPSGPVLAAILAVIGVAFLILGVLVLNVCGGGYSLVYFGFGVLLLSLSAATIGAIPALAVGGPVGVALIAWGLIVQNGVCHSFSL